MTALLAIGGFLKKVPAWLWVALAAIVLLVVAYFYLSAREEADDKRNQEIGGQIQREGDLRKTIERTEIANEARDDIRSNRDRTRYDQCLRTARTPANCERLLPSE